MWRWHLSNYIYLFKTIVVMDIGYSLLWIIPAQTKEHNIILILFRLPFLFPLENMLLLLPTLLTPQKLFYWLLMILTLIIPPQDTTMDMEGRNRILIYDPLWNKMKKSSLYWYIFYINKRVYYYHVPSRRGFRFNLLLYSKWKFYVPLLSWFVCLSPF